MRLADVILRRGHLSEDALVDIWSTGVRTAHLDQCDICASRATEISRWLEGVRALGRADADATFPEERIVAQRDQIMARLEQLDRPAKVISFPARASQAIVAGAGRGVSPGWLAAAAAAGLMLGVFSVELRYSVWPASSVADGGSAEVASAGPAVAGASSSFDASILSDDPYSHPQLGQLNAMGELTPRLIEVVAVVR
jgi:hypothetical protein